MDITIEDGGAQTTLHFDSAEEARAALASRGIACSDAVFEGGVGAAAPEPAFVPVVSSFTESDAKTLEFVIAASTPLRGELVAAWLADVVVKGTAWSEPHWLHFVWSADGCAMKFAAWNTRPLMFAASKIASAARETPLPEALRQVHLVVVAAVSKERCKASVTDATVSEDSDTRALTREVGWFTRRVNIRRCPIYSYLSDTCTSSSFLLRMAMPDAASEADLEAAAEWVRDAFNGLTAGTEGFWVCNAVSLMPADTTVKGIAVDACYDCGGWSRTNRDDNPLCVVTKHVTRGFKTEDMSEALRNAEFPDALARVTAMGVSAVAPF